MPSTTAADTLNALTPFLAPLAAATITLSRASPVDAERIQVAMRGVTYGVSALAAAETAAQSRPIVERIEADVCAVLHAAAAVPLPVPFGLILTIASSMAPPLFSAVNTLLAHRVTVPTPTAAALAVAA